ncbi:MAG: hypothetical protein HY270_17665 [Deltaproteobacteria bacterium]|nr:hypothetical protein [Deltaproteobacteria bacterium]
MTRNVVSFVGAIGLMSSVAWAVDLGTITGWSNPDVQLYLDSLRTKRVSKVAQLKAKPPFLIRDADADHEMYLFQAGSDQYWVAMEDVEVQTKPIGYTHPLGDEDENAAGRGFGKGRRH